MLKHGIFIALPYRVLKIFRILGSPSHHNLFGGVNDDPHDPMDTNDPFGFSSLGGGLGLSGFGPQVRPGNTPFRSHSFNIGGHRAGGGQKVIFVSIVCSVCIFYREFFKVKSIKNSDIIYRKNIKIHPSSMTCTLP